MYVPTLKFTKVVFALLAAAVLCSGCITHKKHKTQVANGPFDKDCTYIAGAVSHGADLIPGDVPVPTGITFKLWHMIAVDGTVYIGTKVEEKILGFIPLEYGKHVWKARPGEWDNPGSPKQMGKAYDWATVLDKGWGSRVGMHKVGKECTFRRVSDGYIEDFHNDYTLWEP